MKILLVSNNYPSRYMPNRGAFVYNLAQELAVGNQVTVISPLKLNDLFKPKVLSYGHEKCRVLRPVYLSVGRRRIFGVNLASISFFFQSLAVHICAWMHGKKADIVYTHFLINALSILNFARKYRKPLVIATGESTYNHLEFTSVSKLRELFKYARYFICVSSKNRDFLLDQSIPKEKIELVPNAVNYEIFKPLNIEHSKAHLGFNKNDFVVGFVGHFIERKGPNRVINAIQLLNDPTIKLVCVGDGGELLPNNFTKRIGPVSNIELPEIMNAFDVFVLPTLNEGHCNVIEEAKACTIPVISSLGTTVEQQIDERTGLLIDPMNINQIADAIKVVKSNGELRANIKKHLYNNRGSNSMKARGQRISNILEKVRNGF